MAALASRASSALLLLFLMAATSLSVAGSMSSEDDAHSTGGHRNKRIRECRHLLAEIFS